MSADKMSGQAKRSVLITGCSDGSLGAALAIAFHHAGLKVYATARDPTRMSEVAAKGIETLTLDVLSESSIAECVAKLSSLDILVNNAGVIYSMPVADLDLAKAKQLFDLNVWSYLAVTQAFLPLLLQSRGMIVNQTSSAAVLTIPFQSAYNASKAAMTMFTDITRAELAPFHIRVVNLKTSSVASNNFKNQQHTAHGATLPPTSIYRPAADVVEKTMRGDYATAEVTAEQYATRVVRTLLKTNPPPDVWEGTKAWLVRLLTFLPFGTAMLNGMMEKMTGMHVVEQRVSSK
jgi:NADP-dependent 3-hydroxy acid dehydrogenase YdfG